MSPELAAAAAGFALGVALTLATGASWRPGGRKLDGWALEFPDDDSVLFYRRGSKDTPDAADPAVLTIYDAPADAPGSRTRRDRRADDAKGPTLAP